MRPHVAEVTVVSGSNKERPHVAEVMVVSGPTRSGGETTRSRNETKIDHLFINRPLPDTEGGKLAPSL